MSVTQAEKAARFRALHDGPGVFVIPNPWDVASARILAGLGLEAIQLRVLLPPVPWVEETVG
jgi:2-methylisocitrate lyase-like PEP mutase family enzyme